MHHRLTLRLLICPFRGYLNDKVYCIPHNTVEDLQAAVVQVVEECLGKWLKMHVCYKFITAGRALITTVECLNIYFNLRFLISF